MIYLSTVFSDMISYHFLPWPLNFSFVLRQTLQASSWLGFWMLFFAHPRKHSPHFPMWLPSPAPGPILAGFRSDVTLSARPSQTASYKTGSPVPWHFLSCILYFAPSPFHPLSYYLSICFLVCLTVKMWAPQSRALLLLFCDSLVFRAERQAAGTQRSLVD